MAASDEEASTEHLSSDPFSQPTTTTLESSDENEKHVPDNGN